jgi:hypothetical protein
MSTGITKISRTEPLPLMNERRRPSWPRLLVQLLHEGHNINASHKEANVHKHLKFMFNQNQLSKNDNADSNGMAKQR